MADDYLDQALNTITQQALTQNPYIQFGQVLGQAKNPFLVSDDPWGSLAAQGVQSLVSGLASGYGKRQVQEDLSMVPQILPQLYANPLAVQNPGMDIGMFGTLQTGAVKQAQDDARKRAMLEQELQLKAKYDPQTGLYRQQAMNEELNFARELAQLYGGDPGEIYLKIKQAQSGGGTPAQQAQAMAPGSIPKPSDVFGAKPATQGTVAAPPLPSFSNSTPTASQPADQVGNPPDRDAIRANMPRTMSSKDANAAAESEYQIQLKAYNDRLAAVAKEKADLKKQQEAQDFDLKKANIEADKDFDTIDQAVTAMSNAMANLPDYSGVLGEARSYLNRLGAGTLLEGSAQQQEMAKKVAAADTIASIAPIAIAPIRKAVLSGSTSNFDVEFLLRAIPDEFKLGESNRAIFKRLQMARDIRKAEKLFRNMGEQKGWTQRQIVDNFNTLRSGMGGSFLDSSGEFKPEFNKMMVGLGGSL